MPKCLRQDIDLRIHFTTVKTNQEPKCTINMNKP